VLVAAREGEMRTWCKVLLGKMEKGNNIDQVMEQL
jgi:hypothetical protein